MNANTQVTDRSVPYAVARIWRGRVPAGRAEEYASYIESAGLPPLAEVALGVEQYQRRLGDDTVEFVTVSYWESVEAMARFTGSDPNVVHHLPRDAEFLHELPPGVEVLHLLSSRWPASDGRGRTA